MLGGKLQNWIKVVFENQKLTLFEHPVILWVYLLPLPTHPVCFAVQSGHFINYSFEHCHEQKVSFSVSTASAVGTHQWPCSWRLCAGDLDTSDIDVVSRSCRVVMLISPEHASEAVVILGKETWIGIYLVRKLRVNLQQYTWVTKSIGFKKWPTWIKKLLNF